MLQNIFNPLFTDTFSIENYLICSAVSLILGVLLALVHDKVNRPNKSMLVSIIMLPFVVQTVLMLVNGNLGTGIAIAGAFGLIRFRSIQCKPEDILLIFVSTAIGLACSVGYIGYAILFTLIVLLFLFACKIIDRKALFSRHRQLRITVPEGTDYETVMTPVLDRFTTYHDLQSVRTSNMGSLFRLTYDIVLEDAHETQNFINELRILNANLEISIGAFPEEGE